MVTVAFAAGGRSNCYLAPTQAARCTVLEEGTAQSAMPDVLRDAVADVTGWVQGWENPRYLSAPSVALGSRPSPPPPGCGLPPVLTLFLTNHRSTGLPHSWSPSLKPVVALSEAHALLGRPGESLPVLKLR